MGADRNYASADLVATSRQVERELLPQAEGLIPSDEDRMEALDALARLIAAERVRFDPATGLPYPASPPPSAPVLGRGTVADAWSTYRAAVGDEVTTLAGRNPAREAMQIRVTGTVDVLVSPEPECPPAQSFVVASGATLVLDTTAAVYARSAGAATTVAVTQTYYGAAL